MKSQIPVSKRVDFRIFRYYSTWFVLTASKELPAFRKIYHAQISLNGVSGFTHLLHHLFPTLLLITEYKYRILKLLFGSSSEELYKALLLMSVFTVEIPGREKFK